ncbi:MAG: SET domain-containing protein-lysine N-methyltransferase [Alphaproteobacteria bacterium]|nr:SET domain-containing protein-lysine N-methyltransferase [Alphaproteobacteria bacterium]
MLTRLYLSRSWIHPALRGGKSAIHGEGAIAGKPFRTGEKLMEFGGETITRAGIDSALYRPRSIWAVADGTWLALSRSDPRPSLDENLNHCCDANAWLADEVSLVARRNIAAGEEITLDQGTWNFDEDDYLWDCERCRCGARTCRGRLSASDWKLPVVQARYRGHFHPLVVRRMERQARRAS